MASTNDVLLIGVLVFIFAIGFFVVFYMSASVTNSMLTIPTINESAATKEVLESSAAVRAQMDYVILGLFIGLILALIISGWFVGGHPIFMAIYFLIIMLSVAISPILSNVWETTTTSSIFGSTISHFPITNNILSNLPIYIAVIGFLGLVVMFAKPYMINTGNENGTY